MLSMGTVFHDIVLKKPDSGLMDIEEEEEEEELELPEPEVKEADEDSESDNSDEEWDTDLEDTGDIQARCTQLAFFILNGHSFSLKEINLEWSIV